MKLLLPGAPGATSAADQPLSALQEALQGEHAAAALAQALAALDGLEQRLRQTAAPGLPPAHYAVLASALDACQAARETFTMQAGKGQQP